jgi:hypothetical protein
MKKYALAAPILILFASAALQALAASPRAAANARPVILEQSGGVWSSHRWPGTFASDADDYQNVLSWVNQQAKTRYWCTLYDYRRSKVPWDFATYFRMHCGR